MYAKWSIQLKNSSTSNKAFDTIAILANEITTIKIYLHIGWNLIGFTNVTADSVETYFKDIIEFVEVVKDFDNFWDTELQSELNLLEFGKGYFVNISQDCILEIE